MKVLLLLFLFCLISGPVSCFDVIGYSGGTVMINCKDKLYGWNTKYFCKTSTKKCVYLDQLQRTNDYDGRAYLHGPPGARVVVYRNLSLQDAGLYRCGETRLWGHDLKLTVIKDPCCSGSKTVAGYLGENVTISCSYPEEFKINIKTFHKQGGQYFTELIDTTMTHRGRFSISEDRGSRVLSVRIRDVREDDKGEYYCGVWKAEESISYYSLHTEIQLQVTALPAPTPTPPGEDHSSGRTVLISVCVCVVLLLIGGSALIIYIVMRLKKRQDSDSSSRMQLKDIKQPSQVPPVASNSEALEPPRRESAFGVYANVAPPTDSSDIHICYTVQPPNDQDPTYTTVSFQKNQASTTDTSVYVSKEEPATEYTTLLYNTPLS